MSEAKLWDDIRDGMSTRWHAQRHEDKYSTGIPDVSYGIQRRSEGWVELKFVRRLPDFSERPWDFKLDHFTPEQRNWLQSRSRHGTGRLFVACRFGTELVAIWNWARLAPVLGAAPFEQVLKACNAQWWHEPIDFAEFSSVLADNRIIKPRFKL